MIISKNQWIIFSKFIEPYEQTDSLLIVRNQQQKRENYCISHNSRAVVHQWVGAARLGFFTFLRSVYSSEEISASGAPRRTLQRSELEFLNI